MIRYQPHARHFLRIPYRSVNTSGNNDFAGVNATTLAAAPTDVIAGPGNNLVASPGT